MEKPVTPRWKAMNIHKWMNEWFTKQYGKIKWVSVRVHLYRFLSIQIYTNSEQIKKTWKNQCSSWMRVQCLFSGALGQGTQLYFLGRWSLTAFFHPQHGRGHCWSWHLCSAVLQRPLRLWNKKLTFKIIRILHCIHQHYSWHRPRNLQYLHSAPKSTFAVFQK